MDGVATHHRRDPFGYRSRRDGAGNLVHPRELVIEPTEAPIVRRVWSDLVEHSLTEVAERLNRDGIPPRIGGIWTRDAIKDIYRRGRMYFGFVVEKRGRDERPGRHEPILTEPEYQRTMAAVAARRRLGNKPKPFRYYTLRGLLHCTFERVTVRDREVETIEWTPAAKPFFERQRECPQGALETRPLFDDGSLAWYVA